MTPAFFVSIVEREARERNDAIVVEGFFVASKNRISVAFALYDGDRKLFLPKIYDLSVVEAAKYPQTFAAGYGKAIAEEFFESYQEEWGDR